MDEEILIPLSMFAAIFGIVYLYFTTRNKERLALIEKGAALSDIDERKKIYRKVDEIVLGQSIVVPMVYQTFVTVASKKVGNIDTVSMHDGKMNFREVCMTE